MSRVHPARVLGGEKGEKGVGGWLVFWAVREWLSTSS